MAKTINPPMAVSLVSVTQHWGGAVRCWDDGMGQLWLYQDAGGTLGVVRAQTWEDAYDCVLDEILTPIPADEVAEAYGFPDQAALDAAIAAGAEPELVEGYQYQSNATGTGIVPIDLNGELLEPLTVERVRQMDLRVKLSAS